MKIYNFLKTYIGAAYGLFASFCSIASLVLLFVNSRLACIIALAVFCLGLLAIIYGIIRGINKMVRDNSHDEYRRIASFFIFQSGDGVKSTFEVFRVIQSKRLFLTEIPYNFKWTGTTPPAITSRLQTIANVKYNKDKSQWDEATIKFPQPLKYNESTVVNVKTVNDDHDNTAKPFLTSKLEAPIDMIAFRVLLSYKPDGYNKPATLQRKKVGTAIDGDYETIGSVPFDKEHKLYYHCLTSPEPGYIYKIEWEK